MMIAVKYNHYNRTIVDSLEDNWDETTSWDFLNNMINIYKISSISNNDKEAHSMEITRVILSMSDKLEGFAFCCVDLTYLKIGAMKMLEYGYIDADELMLAGMYLGILEEELDELIELVEFLGDKQIFNQDLQALYDYLDIEEEFKSMGVGLRSSYAGLKW